MGYKIAIIGATGNVGHEMLSILAERDFPIDEVVALASEKSEGKEVSFGTETLKVHNLDTFNFNTWDIALSSPGAKVSAQYSPIAAQRGCVVIDNTSHFRMDPDVPLIVPEVNPQAIAGYSRRNIIANPNCSTIQMVVVLKPLHDLAHVRRVVVSTYQSVSGAGHNAMDELSFQTHSVCTGDLLSQKVFAKQIAFNVIPHIDRFMSDGSTMEEWKMAVETQKILDHKIKVCASCVRVPVFIGHAEAVHIEFERPISAREAYSVLQNSPGIVVVDSSDGGSYITPIEAAGKDPVYVSRVREDPTVDNGLALWIVADNLRKGAALNAIQIAELLVHNHMTV
jgi:aspartate-semialdehyde dehydrogenase